MIWLSFRSSASCVLRPASCVLRPADGFPGLNGPFWRFTRFANGSKDGQTDSLSHRYARAHQQKDIQRKNDLEKNYGQRRKIKEERRENSDQMPGKTSMAGGNKMRLLQRHSLYH